MNFYYINGRFKAQLKIAKKRDTVWQSLEVVDESSWFASVTVRIEILEVVSGAGVRVYNVGEETIVVRWRVTRGIHVHDVVNSHGDVPVRLYWEIDSKPVAVKTNVAADCIKQNGSNKNWSIGLHRIKTTDDWKHEKDYFFNYRWSNINHHHHHHHHYRKIH